MLNSSEYSGLWWLPSNPENKVHGKLSYDVRKGTTLSLDGAFLKNPDGIYEIILGKSSDGKSITLRNCLRTNLISTVHPPNSKHYKTSEFIVSIFFVGAHFLKQEDIKFTRLSIVPSQLEEWLGERLFHLEETENEEGLRQQVLKFTMPKVKKIALDGFEISTGYGFSAGMGDWLRPAFEASVWISIETDKETYLDDLFSIVYCLRNFLSLAIGNSVSILAMTGYNKNINDFKAIEISIGENFMMKNSFLFHSFPFNTNPYRNAWGSTFRIGLI